MIYIYMKIIYIPLVWCKSQQQLNARNAFCFSTEDIIKFHIQHAKAPADYIKLYPTSGRWSIFDTLLHVYFGAVRCNVVTYHAHIQYNHRVVAYYLSLIRGKSFNFLSISFVNEFVFNLCLIWLYI